MPTHPELENRLNGSESMVIDPRGEFWKGSEASDLRKYLERYTSQAYAAQEFRNAKCTCGSEEFRLDCDDDEGTARRTCSRCKQEHFICDSEEYWDGAEPDQCICICEKSIFNIMVAFALYPESDDVKWMYIGCRCVACGILGCYGDWKIGYGPSNQLFDKV
jgi:hypothetical protein